MLPYYTTNKPGILTDVVKWEADPDFSREKVTVLAGAGADRALKVGEVIGKRTRADPVIAADGGNTGDGALGTLTPNKRALIGVYSVICVVAAANAGTFAVFDPNGHRMEDAEVGVAYSNPDLDFTLTDGAADFVVDDKFTITIAEGDGKVVALDLAGTNGEADAWGVLGSDVTAPDGADATGFAVARQAILSDGGLIWPAGITAPQKADALNELAAAGLVARTEA